MAAHRNRNGPPAASLESHELQVSLSTKKPRNCGPFSSNKGRFSKKGNKTHLMLEPSSGVLQPSFTDSGPDFLPLGLAAAVFSYQSENLTSSLSANLILAPRAKPCKRECTCYVS